MTNRPTTAPIEPARPTVWTVRPGDSFWSIAARQLLARPDQPPTVSDIGRYWVTLIEANRSRLADPGNPDLLFPGQDLVLPPLP